MSTPLGSESLSPPPATGVLIRRARARSMFFGFIGVSLALHLGCFAAWALWPASATPAIDLDANIVKTKLVKLGKPRDERLLPRLPTSPPPPPADKKAPAPVDAKPAPPAPPKPEATEKPSAADILNRLKAETKPDVNALIRDRIGAPTDEGREDGDADGSALTGEIQATYFQRVIAHIRRHMEVSSTLSDEERVRLKATLFVRIGNDGTVLDAKVQRSSGSPTFDNDVLAAAKRASPVPAPPPPVRGVVEKGVGINFCPTSCS